MAEKKVLTIDDFAKHLGVKPASARGMLRRSKIKRPGSSWEWSNEAAMKADAKKLKGPVVIASKAAKKAKKKIVVKKKKKVEPSVEETVV